MERGWTPLIQSVAGCVAWCATGHFEFTRALHVEDGLVWYIVIADCSLEQIYHDVPPIVFDVELMNGESHLPAEEFGLAWVYTALVVILVLAGGYGFTLVQEQKSNLGSLHLIVKLLLLAYALNLVSTSLECTHLWIYAANGKGSWFFNKLGELIQASFCVVVNFVLLCLACGWTLTQEATTASFMEAFRDPAKLFQFVTVGGFQVPHLVLSVRVFLVPRPLSPAHCAAARRHGYSTARTLRPVL